LGFRGDFHGFRMSTAKHLASSSSFREWTSGFCTVWWNLHFSPHTLPSLSRFHRLLRTTHVTLKATLTHFFLKILLTFTHPPSNQWLEIIAAYFLWVIRYGMFQLLMITGELSWLRSLRIGFMHIKVEVYFIVDIRVEVYFIVVYFVKGKSLLVIWLIQSV